MPSAPTSRRPKTLKQPHPAPLSISAPSSWRPRPMSRGSSPSMIAAARGLPSGPLQSQHRTLEMGLRTWVAEQTQLTLGYVEQLYTFGDRDRAEADDPGCRACPVDCLSGPGAGGPTRRTGPCGVAELVLLTSRGRTGATAGPRRSRASSLRLKAWARAGGKPLRQFREERIELTFGFERRDLER